jgi:exonuclease III
MSGYTTVTNMGTDKRGTALLVKDGLQVSDIRRIPTGRGIAARIENTWIINIYAPSGTARKTERENFYNTEITHLVPQTPTEMILGGDFNCTQTNTDCTGTQQRSAALEKIIQCLGLTDAWSPQNNNEGYTHYTPFGASRIERINLRTGIMSRKTGIETQVMVFTDHSAVIIGIALVRPIPRRGRGFWKMNSRHRHITNTLRVMEEE